ncbi:MAG: anaerobic ribonucleoside-triphosphate reductase activating protein [Clostridia bacterium]|nr:anaerobic ribonucleoside-triphosphate reductase activating protein [Clostridia bacterium]
MKICGLMKTTLLDFPGRVACTVFLGGCNLRCPFCHNSRLAFKENGDVLSENEFFTFLDRRKGVLDAVCVSGGEPLMHKEVFEFLKKIKDMGFLVKLDTNGCFPKMLETALASGSVDYVAMDIKNSLPQYGAAVGIDNFDTGNIESSIEILKNTEIEHEFRTTLVKGIHTEEDVIKMARMIAGEKRYFLQGFKMSDGVPDKTLAEFTKEEMENLLKSVRQYVPDAELRGI